MNINYKKLKSKDVVFIAEMAKPFENIKLTDLHLEMTDPYTYNLIMEVLKKLCHKVYHYQSLNEFEDNISTHRNDVILSLWSGVKSRNRKSLIPSICEANGICYVGADAYMHIISQDKRLAKEFCKQYGILSAKDVLIRTIDDFIKLKNLAFPIVIKPNFEGGSIGISNKNIVYTSDEAIALCNRLLKSYDVLLAEEYIQGYELCICISGILGEIDVFEAVQTNFGGQTYITSEIYGYEYKKGAGVIKSKEKATALISKDLKEQLLELYWSLGKVEVMRIDGRLDKNNTFRLIELSPDCSLNAKASTATSYNYSGYTYEEMMASLLCNAIKNWEYQNAKMK